MHLLNITSITNLSTTFNIGFALLLKENKEAFTFLITALKGALAKAEIPTP